MRLLAQLMVMAAVLAGAARALAEPVQRPNRERPVKSAKPAKESHEVELSDDAKLAGVVSLYEAGKYGECASELARLLTGDPHQRLHEREIVESARIYHAACLIGSGNPEAANEPLRAAIRSNIQMRAPDSLVFPPPVIERFLRVRQSLYDEIKKAEEERVDLARKAAETQAARQRAENARVAELERLASREVLVVRNHRWVALVPFGVGQFQNDADGLGWVFLTGETALAATALTSLGMQSYLGVQAQKLKNPDNNSVLRTWHTLLTVSSYSFIGVAAVGILQAQLAFVPEVREERPRSLPDRLKSAKAAKAFVPNISAGPNQVFVGFSGSF
jgi:hypothetical protein